MSGQFIVLKCPHCGANLQIYDDMDNFACAYCGTHMAAQRRGGTVSLKAVAEAIKNVQIGTDKTAAELAISRLQADLSMLAKDHERILGEQNRAYQIIAMGALLLVADVALLIVLLCTANWACLWFVVLLACAGVGLFRYGFSLQKDEELQASKSKMSLVNQRIQENRRIVEG